MVALLPSALAAAALAASASAAAVRSTLNSQEPIADPLPGYIAKNFGTYAPYIEAGKYPDVPKGCSLEMVNILERHGARSPTTGSSASMNASVVKLQSATSFAAELAFVPSFTWTLGAENLIPFGAWQAWQSGQRHWQRYGHLAGEGGRGFAAPFVRSDSEQRVVDTAGNWSEGFYYHKHETAAPTSVIIDGSTGFNNTLTNVACPNSPSNSEYEAEWQSIFLATPTARLNALAPGANLTVSDSLYLLELCGFQSLYDEKKSDWCSLFTPEEYAGFEYYYDLDKYWGYAYGNNLSAVQGAGYVNELLARLTNDRSYVLNDRTSVNHTLDSSSTTFPLGRRVYADFSHDNQMAMITTALGLKKDPNPLAATGPREGQVWVTSQITPFSANLVTEKLTCGTGKKKEEYVRFLISDELQIPTFCEGYDKETGLCPLSSFVKSQAYSINSGNGDYAQCGFVQAA